jgi:SAM-dependent methyltransferase
LLAELEGRARSRRRCAMQIREPYKRLFSLWGHIDNSHNRMIASHIKGKRVLDIGCGYGSLVNHLTANGFDATGIDSNPKDIEIGKRLFPNIDIKVADVEEDIGHQLGNKKFDAIILKDVLHHIYEESVDPAIVFIKFKSLLNDNGGLILFDPNPNLIVRMARKIIRHEDPECSLKDTMDLLRKTGFKVLTRKYYELFGLPLSGGYVGVRLLPNIEWLNRAVQSMNHRLSVLVNGVKLGSVLCWRYLVVATQEGLSENGIGKSEAVTS